MNVEILYAKWMFGEIPNEEVPRRLAGEAQGPAVLNLISLQKAGRIELEAAFEAVFRERGESVPSLDECALRLAHEFSASMSLESWIWDEAWRSRQR